MKKEIKPIKSEIEKLVEEIYHKQTYGLDCDKHIERLKKLTNIKNTSK